jgi:DNA-binding protein YbaB
MFDKINQAKQMAEQTKVRLSNITVEGVAANGKIRIVADANKKVKEVIIDDTLISPERKEELQDLLAMAIDDALTQAENVSAAEMQAMMNSMLPGGLGKLFGK